MSGIVIWTKLSCKMILRSQKVFSYERSAAILLWIWYSAVYVMYWLEVLNNRNLYQIYWLLILIFIWVFLGMIVWRQLNAEINLLIFNWMFSFGDPIHFILLSLSVYLFSLQTLRYTTKWFHSPILNLLGTEKKKSTVIWRIYLYNFKLLMFTA